MASNKRLRRNVVTVSGIRETLAENIREAAKRAELGHNALADLSGVSRSHLYDILASRKAASVDWLASLADSLQVETHELLMKPPARKRTRRAA